MRKTSNFNFHKVRKKNLKTSAKITVRFPSYGQLALISTEATSVLVLQVEKIILRLRQLLTSGERYWIFLRGPLSYTAKKKSRLGRGKGEVQGFRYKVKKGQKVLEVKTGSDIRTKLILKAIRSKIPFKTKIIK